VLDFAARDSVATALQRNAELRGAVLIWQGRLNHAGIAAESGLPYTALTDADLAEAA